MAEKRQGTVSRLGSFISATLFLIVFFGVIVLVLVAVDLIRFERQPGGLSIHINTANVKKAKDKAVDSTGSALEKAGGAIKKAGKKLKDNGDDGTADGEEPDEVNEGGSENAPNSSGDAASP